MKTRDAVIVAAARTAVGKAKRGSWPLSARMIWLRVVIQELLKRAPRFDPAEMDDVILGCAFPEGEQGLNMARTVALRAGLPYYGPRRDDQPLLLFRLAIHCPRGLCDHDRADGSRHRRRRGIDEHGADDRQ